MKSDSKPRWQAAIENALEKDTKANVIQLATIDSDAPEKPMTPRVRSLIHRSFLAPRSAGHPLLLTTTDIRTPKAHQIAQNASVELAWWISITQEQFRVAGKAYVLPTPDIKREDAEGAVGEARMVSAQVTAQKLRDDFPGDVLGGEGFDWEGKRREVFESMSGHMKASWLRPVPGTPLSGGYATAKEWPETLPKDRDIVEQALRNFALLVIDPLEVDHIELGVIPNQRTIYTRQGEGWVEQIVVP